MPDLHIVEASIADLRRGLEEGAVSSVDLVGAYLRRIAHYDRHGIALQLDPVRAVAERTSHKLADALMGIREGGEVINMTGARRVR